MPGTERGFHLHIAAELIVGLAFDFHADAHADVVDAELVAGGLQVSAHSQIVDCNEDRRELRKDILAVTGELLGVHVNPLFANRGVGAAVPVPPIYLIRGASRTPTGPPALVMAPSSL